MKKQVVVIAHNIRSAHNIGSLFRTCDGLGIDKLFLTGYTPYPHYDGDTRLPYMAEKVHVRIHKTALGSEANVAWKNLDNIFELIIQLRKQKYKIIALEQTPNSTHLPDFIAPSRLALILGSEIDGLDEQIINSVDKCIDIPMLGKKESLNVVQAAAIALYHCKFITK